MKCLPQGHRTRTQDAGFNFVGDDPTWELTFYGLLEPVFSRTFYDLKHSTLPSSAEQLVSGPFALKS